MSSITVCVRFRPLSSRERIVHGDSVCVQSLDMESFVFKDSKDEDIFFCFDRVFYDFSSQEDIYNFLVLPIIQDAINARNGTIIAYGQGPSISECEEEKKGILPRLVDGLFNHIASDNEGFKYRINLSMVEIYMEKVRDLFDLSRDNLQIKECKMQGIFLSGATEISILDAEEALSCLARGIANRAVGDTLYAANPFSNSEDLTWIEMNLVSSRSHCLYIFSVTRKSINDGRVKTGKLVLVDLAGSEKAEKTYAEGKVLEEAKTINKSLSALGNVISALTDGKSNHIPFRDSKLTRILQDALQGGNSRTSLLCCCSLSSLNASESLSTLRFGARAKHVKTSPILCGNEDKGTVKQVSYAQTNKTESNRLLNKLRESLKIGDVKLLEELLIMEGIMFDPYATQEDESAIEDLTSQTISVLCETVEEQQRNIEALKKENNDLKAKVAASEKLVFT